MLRQQRETYVTLNSLISACIIQDDSKSVLLSKLIDKASLIYEYIKEKPFAKTMMTTQPQQLLVEMHVEGLGFQMSGKGSKKCSIELASLSDVLRQQLILSHYMMQMIPLFVPEGCIAIYMFNKLDNDGQLSEGPFELEPLFNACKTFNDLLRNEHLFTYNMHPRIMMERVGFFERKGILKVSDCKRFVSLVD